jgi:hypothetical protein
MNTGGIAVVRSQRLPAAIAPVTEHGKSSSSFLKGLVKQIRYKLK